MIQPEQFFKLKRNTGMIGIKSKDYIKISVRLSIF